MKTVQCELNTVALESKRHKASTCSHHPHQITTQSKAKINVQVHVYSTAHSDQRKLIACLPCHTITIHTRPHSYSDYQHSLSFPIQSPPPLSPLPYPIPFFSLSTHSAKRAIHFEPILRLRFLSFLSYHSFLAPTKKRPLHQHQQRRKKQCQAENACMNKLVMNNVAAVI